jgi:hypothetical protein
MSAAATAPGYWRICNSLGDFPSTPSRPSSTYSSSRRTSSKDGDQRKLAVTETAERTARGRTSRRQRFVAASVGVGLCGFRLGRGARPERADVGARAGDAVSGRFRREGMGAPGNGDTPPPLTASRPMPSLWPQIPCEFAAFLEPALLAGGTVSGMPYPERNQKKPAALSDAIGASSSGTSQQSRAGADRKYHSMSAIAPVPSNSSKRVGRRRPVTATGNSVAAKPATTPLTEDTEGPASWFEIAGWEFGGPTQHPRVFCLFFAEPIDSTPCRRSCSVNAAQTASISSCGTSGARNFTASPADMRHGSRGSRSATSIRQSC